MFARERAVSVDVSVVTVVGVSVSVGVSVVDSIFAAADCGEIFEFEMEGLYFAACPTTGEVVETAYGVAARTCGVAAQETRISVESDPVVAEM